MGEGETDEDEGLLSHDEERVASHFEFRNLSPSLDFHDVFGGPPRRSSIQEVCYGIGESLDFSTSRMEEDGAWCAWPEVREKPVFGEEILNRRRHTNDDFYDDIFRGEESPCRTPVKHERHPFSSTPASRIMSPAPSLPPVPNSSAPPSIPSTFRRRVTGLLLMFMIISHANCYKRYTVPVLSIQMDFYVCVFVRIYISASAMKSTPATKAFICLSVHWL
ncbi:hypothetical protein K1719_006044 [Acacia pycnantha]|nr:hypothetical protein K1719_006044 [Acacia pycnantha]